MCHLFKRKQMFQYPSSSPSSNSKKANTSERIYDVLAKPSIRSIGAIAVTLFGLANAKSMVVALLCGALIWNGWQWTIECNIQKKSLKLIIMLCIIGVSIKFFPYIQNRVSHSDLRIPNLIVRPDGDHNILVNIENKGEGDLSETKPFLGVVYMANKKIVWIPATRSAFIRSGDSTIFGFPKTDLKFDFCIGSKVTLKSIHRKQ